MTDNKAPLALRGRDYREYAFQGTGKTSTVYVSRSEIGGVSFTIQTVTEGEPRCQSAGVTLYARDARLIGKALQDLADAADAGL